MLQKNLDDYDEQFGYDDDENSDDSDDEFPPITINFN